MEPHGGQQKHRYRLELADDKKGCAQRIELEAPNALRAMSLVHTSHIEREIELYEDERPLGKVLCDTEGYWTVLPMHASNA